MKPLWKSSRINRWIPWAPVVLGIHLALAAPDSQEFTVATFNVLCQNRDLPRLAATLLDTGADLIALQETNPASEKFLRRELAAHYPHMAFRGGLKGSDGFGFLSKVPLGHLRFLEPLPAWRGAWIATVRLGPTNLPIANVHLATPPIGRMRSLATIRTAFEETEDVHAREIERIHQHLTHRIPALVVGDFNSFSFFRAPVFLVGRGFVDSFASVTPDADRHGTWEFRRGEHHWRFRIDFIFHTSDLMTVTSRILASSVSDHQPVVSRLRRREPRLFQEPRDGNTNTTRARSAEWQPRPQDPGAGAARTNPSERCRASPPPLNGERAVRGGETTLRCTETERVHGPNACAQAGRSFP